jgi:hypothetical protein
MTLTIELPPDVDNYLKQDAERRHADPNKLRADLFAHFLKMVDEIPIFQVPMAKLGYEPAKYARELMIQSLRNMQEAETRFSIVATWEAEQAEPSEEVEEDVLAGMLDELMLTGQRISNSLNVINNDLKAMVAIAQGTR